MPEPTVPEPLVHVNGQAEPWRDGLDIAALLAQHGTAPEAVATALNGEFVPRALRASTLLQPGDSLTLFAAIVGG